MILRKLDSNDVQNYKNEFVSLLQEVYSINFSDFSNVDNKAEETFKRIYQYSLDGSAILFGVIHETLIGFVWAYVRDVLGEKRIHVDEFVIANTYRGSGLGTSLQQFLEDIAKEIGIEKLELMVTDSNEHAVSFYLKNGYVTKRSLMEKDLKSSCSPKSGLIAISLESDKKWASVAKSFRDFDVYYLSGYVRAFEINGDGTPTLFFYEDEDIRAMNVVMVRDIAKFEPFHKSIPKNTYFDLVTPYGYGGWLIEVKKDASTGVKTLDAIYTQYCVLHNYVCEFVRFHPLLHSWKQLKDVYDVQFLGNTVVIDTSNIDIIWNNFTSKNRNKIREAQKSGLKTYWGREPHMISKFIEIYKETMDTAGATQYYYFSEDFYRSILEDLKDNAMWFYTETDGIVAAISIFMFCNRKMHYHLSASRREYRNIRPTNLMLYEAAMWGCKNGYSKLHLGGGVGARHDSLYQFKKSFNRGKDCEYNTGRKIFMPDVYKKLCDERGKDPVYDPQTVYFPAYRG
jgi:ribosomal protein S18 acetylase RimI-like enzyme